MLWQFAARGCSHCEARQLAWQCHHTRLMVPKWSANAAPTKIHLSSRMTSAALWGRSRMAGKRGDYLDTLKFHRSKWRCYEASSLPAPRLKPMLCLAKLLGAYEILKPEAVLQAASAAPTTCHMSCRDRLQASFVLWPASGIVNKTFKI